MLQRTLKCMLLAILCFMYTHTHMHVHTHLHSGVHSISIVVVIVRELLGQALQLADAVALSLHVTLEGLVDLLQSLHQKTCTSVPIRCTNLRQFH